MWTYPMMKKIKEKMMRKLVRTLPTSLLSINDKELLTNVDTVTVMTATALAPLISTKRQQR